MRVQRVRMVDSGLESWTVLGDDQPPLPPVERYLSHLTLTQRSPNTVKAYAHDLKDWFVYLTARGLDWQATQLEDVAHVVMGAQAQDLDSTSGPSWGWPSGRMCAPSAYHPPRTEMAEPQTWHAYEWSSLTRWTTSVLRTNRWTVVATLDAGPGSTASGVGRRS